MPQNPVPPAASPTGPPAPPKPPASATPQPEAARPGHMPMSEEFDRAKWTLPPAGIVVIGIGVIAIALTLLALVLRPKLAASGSIDDITAVQTQGDQVLVAISLSLTNIDKEPLKIYSIKAGLETDKGKWSDVAASAVDFERYFQAFPDLRAHAREPLTPETRIQPGGQASGTVIVSFPVTKDAFDQRKVLSVTIQPERQRPVTLTK